MRVLLLVLIVSSFSFSDWLFKDINKCVSYYRMNNPTQATYRLSTDPSNVNRTTYTTEDKFVAGYVYDSVAKTCTLVPVPEDKFTDLSDSEKNLLYSYIAHALGFTMLLMVSYLSILVSKN